MMKREIVDIRNKIERIDSKHEKGTLFAIIPEQVIWTHSLPLIEQLSSGELLILVREIDHQFESLQKKFAIKFLINLLYAEVNDIVFEATVKIILSRASVLNNEESLEIFDALESVYREYLLKVSADSVFRSRAALEGLVLLPIYAGQDSLQVMALGTLLNRFPPVLQLKDELDYLAVRGVQLLRQYYEISPDERITKKVKQLTHEQNFEVSSEAHFCLGTIYLLNAFKAGNNDQLKAGLGEALSSFKLAIQLSENRTDAEVLHAVVNCYLAILGNESSEIESLIQVASDKLIERLMMLESQIEYTEESLRIGLSQIIIILHSWIEQLKTASEWPSIYEPMEQLATLYHSITRIKDSNQAASAAISATEEFILFPELGSRFLQVQAMKAKLSKVLNDPTWCNSVSTSTLQFYQTALNLLTELENSDPKDQAANWAKLLAALEDDQIVVLDEKTKNMDDVDQLLYLIRFQNKIVKHYESGFMTAAAKEISISVRKSVLSKVGWEKGDKKQIYLAKAIDLVAHYFVEINKAKISEASFLFATDLGGLGQAAKEGDLQSHFYESMRMASSFEILYEPTSITPGRPDLALVFPDNIIFPIEVKCEKRNISRENLNYKYLAQSQHFAASLHQVGFLFVLDTTRKPPRQTPDHNTDYFYTDCYEGKANSNKNWIIVVIFEANRYRPHDHTRLSGKLN